MTIGQAFGWLAEQDPDAVAVRAGGETLTRRELDLTTNRIARAWIEHELGLDDVVAVALPNGLDFLLACVAAWKAGATVMPLSPRLRPTEREALLALADPALLVDEPGGRAERYDDAPLPPVAAASWKSPTSSGSTGRPRIIRSTDPATIDPEVAFAPFVPHRAVQLVAGPLFHAAPFVYALRGLMTGHELVVMPRPDAAEWLRLVAVHRVTWGMLVPTTMQRILDVPDRESVDVSSLESVLHLGARCPEPTKRAWIDWLGPERVVELYAGTESQGLAMIDGVEWLARPGSVGRAVGDSEFRVVRPDGADADPGEVGEVLMRRGRPTYEYVGAEARVRDGWHTQGDAGWLDAEGYLYIADRLDDAITTGGTVVHPADVEAVIDAHPAVRSSVVVGRPDAELGMRVHAVVECDGVSLDQLAHWVRGRLDPAKRPHTWELVTEPLRDDTGKVRRSRFR